MGKVLPGLAIAGVALTSFQVFLLGGPFFLILTCLLSFAAGILFFQEYRTLDPDMGPHERKRRNAFAIGLGVALVLFGIVGVVGITPVTTEDVDTTSVSDLVGDRFIIAIGILVAAAVLAYRWTDLEPEWMPIVAGAVYAIGYVAVFFVEEAQFATPNLMSVVAGIVILVGIVPGIQLARLD